MRKSIARVLAAAAICSCSMARATTLDIWSDVTPSAINLDGASFNNDNYGVQDVVVDPARPSDLYAFTCFQGVWKSTDFGVTWTKINTGTGGGSLDQGKLWTAAIDPNAQRDPSAPPTLWTATGDSAAGVWKSTDGGVSWIAHAVNNATAAQASNNAYFGNDVYALDIDPGNSFHLIAGFHGYPGISESTDGGSTWTTIPVPAGIGSSVYPFFVHTGIASATSATWLTQAQWDSNANGIWRTNDAGATWTHVAPTLEHKHGSTQFFQLGNGIVYAPSVNPNGIFRSTDSGSTWTPVSTSLANAVFGTPNNLYSMDSFASNAAYDPNVQSSSNAGKAWTAMSIVPAMTNGAKRAAVTYDGSHYIIVSGNWLGGIWRYVEADDIFANGFD